MKRMPKKLKEKMKFYNEILRIEKPYFLINNPEK